MRRAQLSDEELMEQIVGGKVTAFDQLYDRYNTSLHYYFYRMLGYSNEKAEDFLQDLFIKIIEKPHLFNPKKKFSIWLYSVAHNMCKNEYRSISVRKPVSIEDSAESLVLDERNAEHLFDEDLFIGRLETVLDMLDEELRTIFHLRFREELAIKEIAQIVNVAEGTIKSRLFYTCKKLGRELKEYKY